MGRLHVYDVRLRMAYDPPRERDAWFAIRGFVYQVQLTIERWLQLGPDERLELERGEDIDIVAGWAGSDESMKRLLEQVKHRDSNLTLNSSAARAALANFVEHVSANAGQPLTFRFVTNAAAGVERTPHLPKRRSGIKIWEELRRGDLEDVDKRRRIAALRGLLRRGRCPSDTPQNTWDKYQRFIANAGCEEIDRLIQSFEWSVAHEDVIDLRPAIEQRIAERAQRGEEGWGEQAYDRLFSHVFETLSRRGTKALTGEDLKAALKGTGPDNTRTLKRLTETTVELRKRLDRATERLDAHDSSIQVIQVQVASLAQAAGMTGGFQSDDPIISLTAPPGPNTVARRTRGVELALDELVTQRWLALSGTSGSGKSEFARQMSEAFHGPVHWITLRDLDERQACARIVNSLLHVAGVETGTLDWREDVLRQLGGGLLVLDDLPRFDLDSQLGRTLLPLTDALATHDVSLITTSPFELSSRVRRVATAHSLPVPDFIESEARDLLVAFGAPDTADLDPWAKLVVGTTAGHAELVVTAAAHLRQQGWNFSEERLQELLSRTSETELRSDVLRRVSATTSNDNERELLYRAALISGAFGIEDLRLVARVEDPVPHPDAALAGLEGLWVQPQSGGRFAICPLARQLGDQLAPGVKRKVHSVLGLSYMQRESLGPIEILAAITHFMRAGEADRAGVAYLVALVAVDRKRLPTFDAGLFSLWKDAPLPQEMSTGIKIYLRTMQVGIHEALGNDTDFLVDDLLTLTDSIDDSDVSLLAPIAMHLPVVLQRDFERGSRALTRVIASLDSLRNPMGQPFDENLTDGLRKFLWHQTAQARTPAAVKACLRSFHAIPREILHASTTDDAYQMGAVGLCDGVWLAQFELPEERRDWEGAWALLDELAEQAKELGLSLLTTAARRTQIIIASEVRKDLASAMKIAEDTEFGLDGIEAFLVKECIGRQLVMFGRNSEAIVRLEEALEMESSLFESYRFYARLALAEAYSHHDREKALRTTLDALTISQETKFFPTLERVKALGEAAIATHRHTGARDSFRYVDQAARLLFQVQSESSEWRDLHVLLAHTSGYLHSLAATGRPPPGSPSTGGEYAEPTPGIFLTSNKARPNLYTKAGQATFRSALALFANAVDDDAAVKFWATSLTWGDGDPVMDDFAAMFRTVYLIEEENFAEAISLTESIKAPDVGILHLGLALSAKIAGIAVADQQRALTIAQGLGVDLVARAEGRTDSKSWFQLGHVLEVALDPNFSANEVSKVLEEPGTDAPLSLCALLLASARKGEQVGTVLSAHVGVSMRLLTQKQVFMPLHRRLFLPTIATFWHAFASRSRFRLSGPDVVIGSLKAASELPPSVRAQAILKTIIQGLNLRVPDQIQAWLDKKTA